MGALAVWAFKKKPEKKIEKEKFWGTCACCKGKVWSYEPLFPDSECLKCSTNNSPEAKERDHWRKMYVLVKRAVREVITEQEQKD